MAGSERAGFVRAQLRAGLVIPAHPLALTRGRKLDERRQRALSRYYLDAGAGALAVGVHTTQFEIRAPQHGLYRPVLELAAETARESSRRARTGCVPLVAGVIGRTAQAVAEASLARSIGYDVALLSLAALSRDDDDTLIAHCRAVAEVIPLFGFYLQPSVGGRVLGEKFWRAFAEMEGAWAIKIAPFDRYRTLDVVRAVTAAGRDDIALYTGNDDNIVGDLLTPFPSRDPSTPRYMTGGLLGQWAVWTSRAVDMLGRVHGARRQSIQSSLLAEGAMLTDANAAIFDPANGFAGCIPGIHEVLRRQGLLEGTWCLNPNERLSPGQADAIARASERYPSLTDDDFVRENLDRWMS